jgi:hypothetical protein
MTKVYSYAEKTTAIIRIPVGSSGKAFLNVEFKGGRKVGNSFKPATYCTADPTEQAIIENSPYFGRGVKLVRSYDNGGNEVAPALATDKPEAVEVTIVNVTEVKTREEAVAYLKSKGVKATQLRDDAAIQKQAQRIGVAFPNLFE